MYPTAIIVLIETRRLMVDICEISQSNTIKPVGPGASEARSATLGHVPFVVRPIHSTTDNEAESQLSHTLQGQGGQDHGLGEIILEVK